MCCKLPERYGQVVARWCGRQAICCGQLQTDTAVDGQMLITGMVMRLFENR